MSPQFFIVCLVFKISTEHTYAMPVKERGLVREKETDRWA